MASPPALQHQQKHRRYTNPHHNDTPIPMTNGGPIFTPNAASTPTPNPTPIPISSSHADDALHVSFLQPRVAVVLGVPARWHPFLFIARLLSIVPTLWWGLRCALRFLITELILSHPSFNLGARDDLGLGVAASKVPAPAILTRTQAGHDLDDRLARAERSLRLTETALAIVWCWASAYLAFFFTDCLMSRWLINYTPQATIVRLITLSCVFAYATFWVVHLFTGGGGSTARHNDDPGLLLPAWISIAMILTLCYQATQRKINIRKETRASISVFSYASFISMVALLIHSHCTRASYYGQRYYADIPLVGLLTRAAEHAAELVVKILGVTREMREL